ncbi:substrate-binding periplasmic protein [Paludibacterium yongneupense]|uniref:substrate-binding periplasmic protein n=1 Tax=Paludibacterium yongneupense TaxID=400061 RepID=UPI000429DF0C|nr:ABC transporter substrate-binding protein [Paludibacterium yongneupense]
MSRLHIVLLLLLLTFSRVYAASVIRIGVADTDSPPIVVIAENSGQLVGGLSFDLGTLLAHELGARPQFVVLSRKRVEPWIESGRVDIICNANPAWFGNAEHLGWSREVYPLVERLVSLRRLPDIHQLDDIVGRRIGTIHGYNYPLFDALWEQGRATRIEEPYIDLMMKALGKGLSDVVAIPELSYAAWLRNNAKIAQTFKVHPMIVSSLPTACAVAPHSTFTLGQVNQAIDRLTRNGQLKTLLKSYQ